MFHVLWLKRLNPNLIMYIEIPWFLDCIHNDSPWGDAAVQPTQRNHPIRVGGTLAVSSGLWSCHHDHLQHGPKPLVSFLGFPWLPNLGRFLSFQLLRYDMVKTCQKPRTWPTELQLLQLQLLQAFLQDESGPFTTWLCVTCLGYPWLKSSWREQLGSMPIYGCAYSLRWPKKLLLRVSHPDDSIMYNISQCNIPFVWC